MKKIGKGIWFSTLERRRVKLVGRGVLRTDDETEELILIVDELERRTTPPMEPRS